MMILDKEEVEKMFDEFWSVYPRKIGKHKSFKKFKSFCKDPDVIRLIMEGLEKYLPIYRTRAHKFIPHPYTWLNQRRWEDDIEGEYEEIF